MWNRPVGVNRPRTLKIVDATRTTIHHFLFRNHVLHPLIKRFDPYIDGVQFIVFPSLTTIAASVNWTWNYYSMLNPWDVVNIYFTPLCSDRRAVRKEVAYVFISWWDFLLCLHSATTPLGVTASRRWLQIHLSWIVFCPCQGSMPFHSSPGWRFSKTTAW